MLACLFLVLRAGIRVECNQFVPSLGLAAAGAGSPCHQLCRPSQVELIPGSPTTRKAKRGVPDSPSPVVARSAQTLSNGERRGNPSSSPMFASSSASGWSNSHAEKGANRDTVMRGLANTRLLIDFVPFFFLLSFLLFPPFSPLRPLLLRDPFGGIH